MEPRGVTFLRPIWELITSDGWCSLGLKDNEVDINYRKYINNFKRAVAANENSIEEAVNDRLTPGGDFKME